MYSRVLIPLDGSEDAELAVEEALELAPAVKSAHLVLVETAVLQARRLEGYTVFVDEYVKIRKEMGKDYLLPFQKKLEAAGIEVTATIVFGDPVTTIAKLARKEESDLILLGGKKGGWLARHTGMVGLASRLSRKVDAKVLTVQGGEKRKEKLATAA